jgi:hypothetical protein
MINGILFGYHDTQVGLLLQGCTIESMIVGGPAYNSRQLERGDVILKVDDVVATPASYPPFAFVIIPVKIECRAATCRQISQSF